MALADLTERQWFERLNRKRQDQAVAAQRYWHYYDNEQPLAYVAKILQEQGDRFPPLKINWSALVVDSLEERLDVEGFQLGDSDSLDNDLSDVWQVNDLDEGSGEAHIAAMVARQAYVMLGPSDSGIPVVSVEYPDQVAVEIDPGTRRVVAGIKVWRSDPDLTAEDMACLYLPGRTITYESGKQVKQTRNGWATVLEQHQTSPLVPVVPMLNQPRRGQGRTELQQIIPLVDGVNQTATNMLAAIEHHALPRRWGINLSESDFADKDGRPLPAWKIAAGAVWAIGRATDEQGRPLPGGEADRPQVGQFTASDLTNFHNSIKQLATLAASLYGLPPHYLGYSSENPAIADAIRSSEARLVKRAERRQRTFGGAWERAMRIALAMMERDPNEANKLETVWRDASTPTQASMSDAAVKKVQAGIIDQEQALDDCGYTPAQKAAILRRANSGTDQIGSIVAGLRTLDTARAGTEGGSAGEGPTTEPASVNGVPASAGR